LKKFLRVRIKAKTENKKIIFDTIPRENIAIGLKKEKKREKKIDVLKEDRKRLDCSLAKSKHRRKH